MNRIETGLQDLYLLEVQKYKDDRGFFLESFSQREFDKSCGHYEFVQDNHSKSSKDVLRGLHYQVKNPQGKLVRCIWGSVYDVSVDLRKSSSTFGKFFGVILDRPELMVWVPPGFAHGFYTLTDNVEFLYKTTDYYYPEDQRTLMWNDNKVRVEWPFYDYWGYTTPTLSEKDGKGQSFDECEKYE